MQWNLICVSLIFTSYTIKNKLESNGLHAIKKDAMLIDLNTTKV